MSAQKVYVANTESRAKNYFQKAQSEQSSCISKLAFQHILEGSLQTKRLCTTLSSVGLLQMEVVHMEHERTKLMLVVRSKTYPK